MSSLFLGFDGTKRVLKKHVELGLGKWDMDTNDQLTTRQREVYEFIREKIMSRGYGPTVREIGSAFDINSPNGVMCHLRALEKKGMINREPNNARAIGLAHESREDNRGLPLVGRVAAGVLHEAVEELESIDFQDLFRSDQGLFVLRVTGDSMIEAAITDGDYVVVKPQKTATSGDMVVARTSDGEATLKYWFPERGRIRLQPANSGMEPIFVKDVEVVGIIVGVVRNMK